MAEFTKPKISILLYFIVILFNLSSWIDLDGVWAELPILVPQLPEGWALPSQVTICSQIAAIGPFCYFVANTIKPGVIKESVAVYSVIGVGFTGCILLIFFWDKTAYIAGAERSVALFVLSFFLAFTDNTSTVAFLSYFAILPAEYLSAYYVGEAMCGLVPSVASLIQGAGEYDCVNISTTTNVSYYSNSSTINGSITAELSPAPEWKMEAVMRPPTFSVGVFFGLLAIIMATSGVSFTILNYHPWCKKFHVKDPDQIEDTQHASELNNFLSPTEDSNQNKSNELSQRGDGNGVAVTDRKGSLTGDAEGEKPFMSTRLYVFLLLQYGYLQSARYGLLYNLQSYSLLPYGALAYSLGNRLTTVVQTLACIVALFFPTRSVKVITACTIAGTIPGIFIFVLACLSPDPPFKDTDGGVVLIIFAWLSMSTLWGYCKVGIAVLMKDQGRRHLMMTGTVEVVCILLLSIVIFVLINICHAFKEAPQCPI